SSSLRVLVCTRGPRRLRMGGVRARGRLADDARRARARVLRGHEARGGGPSARARHRRRGRRALMDEPTRAYPLQWPAGWRRTSAHMRADAKFRKGTGGWVDGRYRGPERVTVGEGIN